jgi:hypothetical protein
MWLAEGEQAHKKLWAAEEVQEVQDVRDMWLAEGKQAKKK